MNVLLTPAYCQDSVKPVMHGPGDLVIGRGMHCGMQILAPDISRSHCRLHVDDDHVTVYDLESRNGTFINGKRVYGRGELRHEDILGLGSTMLVVELRRDDGEAPRSPLSSGSSVVR